MPSTLYLDAARMGQMTPSAQWALQDFVRIAGEEGCTLYFERFFQDGFSAWPASFQSRFPGLRSWGGIAELKTTLARYVGLAPDSRTLLAGRSTNLMKLAGRLLFRGGQSVLVTDLAWPSYQRILKREARKAEARLDRLQVRAGVLRRAISAEKLVKMIIDRILAQKAGGVFIPEVSHDGIRLPIAEIVQAIRQAVPNTFVVVDGSQAFGQVPLDLSRTPCDFYLGGCHKWLGSHLPLGIGFCPNPSTALRVEHTCNEMLDRRSLDDPLLAFLESIRTGRQRRFTETVNLSPLFSCRGSVEDQFIEGCLAGRFRRRLRNADMVRRIARMTAWIPILPDEEFRSAGVLLRPASSTVHGCSPAILRERFHSRGIALTCYDHGIIRLSMPSDALLGNQAGMLIQALALIHHHASPQTTMEAQLLHA
jgi:aspartate aminotransferase-like enzyme